MSSVLITGASKGIGRATAAELARRGHRVIATAPDPSTLAGLAVDQRLALDVTNPDSVTSAVGEAGEVDVLVSNAGAIFVAAVEATPPEALARLLDINTIGALRVAQAVLPGMRARAADSCCSCPASSGASRRRARRPTPPPNGPWRRWSRPSRSRRARWGSRPRCSNRARSAPERSTTSPPTPCPTIPIPPCPAAAVRPPAR